MVSTNTVRVVILNLITSLIIAIVTVNILDAFDANAGVYLGNLFGIYFLAVYGVNNLVEAREIKNNHQRFILALFYIAVFDVAFSLLMPYFFGSEVFPPAETLLINLGGANFSPVLSMEFYFVLFALVVLIFNFIIYRRTKSYI